jgi:hypothetical protein
MPLALTVGLLVVGVFAVMGSVGYLIDRSTERHERKQDLMSGFPSESDKSQN